MITKSKRFEAIPGALEFERYLTRAKCPEDLFGISDGILTSHLIEKRRQEFISITGEGSEGADSNATDRLDRIKRIFPIMLKWANEKILANKYGDRSAYRAKIIFLVASHKGQKLFHLEGISVIDLYAESINAMYFEGYDRMDLVTVRQCEKTISGRVEYYGTHAARDMFILNSGLHASSLKARDYEMGDIVEIKTSSYASLDDYAGFLIRTNVEDLPPEVKSVMGEMMLKEEGSWDDVKITNALRYSNSSKHFIFEEF